MENWAKMGLRFAITIKQNRLMCEICLNLTIKTPKKSQWPRAGVFIINFHKISFFCFHPAEKSYYSENSRKFISFYFSFRLSFVFFFIYYNFLANWQVFFCVVYGKKVTSAPFSFFLFQ